MTQSPDVYGILAEFSGPEELVRGAKKVHEEGYRKVEAYSPLPIEGLAEALNYSRTGMPLVILIGGLVGATIGYLFQYWVSVIEYPLNVGGRPLHSWPAFIPVTFEMTILCASLAGVLGMLALNGLPRPHHPLFAVDAFARASRDGFFLCVQSRDPHFSPKETRELLQQAGAVEVFDVPQ